MIQKTLQATNNGDGAPNGFTLGFIFLALDVAQRLLQTIQRALIQHLDQLVRIGLFNSSALVQFRVLLSAFRDIHLNYLPAKRYFFLVIWDIDSICWAT